jgi:hypothetical protein
MSILFWRKKSYLPDLPPSMKSEWIDFADDDGSHNLLNKRTYLDLKHKHRLMVILFWLMLPLAFGLGYLLGNLH